MTTIRPTTWTNENLADALGSIAVGLGNYDKQEKEMLITEASRRLRLLQPEPLTEASRDFALALLKLVGRLKSEGAL